MWNGVLLVLVPLFLTMTLLPGCKKSGECGDEVRVDTVYVEVQGPVKPEPPDGGGGPESQAPDCNDIFPGEETVTFSFNRLSPPTDMPIRYAVSYECPFDLDFFSECCRCKAMLEYLEVSGDINEGDTVYVSCPNSSKNSYSNLPLVVTNGQLDLLGNGMAVEIEDGLEITINISGGDPATYSVASGGLCVIVNIDGGGN